MPSKVKPKTITEPSPGRRSANPRLADAICVLLLLVVTMGVYAPSLFGGRVLLPADIVPIMRPWANQGKEKFADHRNAQTQMHGPIFEYYSWRHYAGERIRQGEVPLWNPYELSGNVLLANSQSAVLYPPNLLLYLFPIHVGINLVTALHTFLTGLFMFGLMRLLRLAPVAAVTSALVWMFCGVQMAWLEFQTPTAALCWLPGLLLCWEVFHQRHKVAVALLGGATGVALTLLAGHLQFAFYVLLAFGIYAFARSVVPALLGREYARFRRGLAVLCSAIVLGVGLSACTLVPVVEMGSMNFRAGKTDYASSVGLRMPPANLLTLFQPNLFGSPRDYLIVDEKGQRWEGWPYWGAFDYIEFSCYLGIPGLVLAILGAGTALRRSKTPDNGAASETGAFPARMFGGIAAVGLLLALGTPLCALVFYGVPGYSQFNATGRALCLFCFGMAGLAGVGLHELASFHLDRRTRIRLGIAVATVAAGGLIAFPGMGLSERKLFGDHWLAYESNNLRLFVFFVTLTALSAWLLFREKSASRPSRRVLWAFPVLAVADLLVTYGGFNPQADPAMLGYQTDTTDFLQAAAPARVVSLEAPEQGPKSFIVPNYNAVVGLREVQGADSLHTKRYHQLMERVVLAMAPQRGAAFSDPNTIHVPNIGHPIFDLLNVRFATTVPPKPNPDPSRLKEASSAELTIWENGRALGPAWIVGNKEHVEGLDAFLSRLTDPTFDPRKTALISSTSVPPLNLSPQATGSPVQLISFEPHRLTFNVDARADGLLVVSEIAFPGWVASVDGRPTTILTADHILRSVPVAAGKHQVEMDYRPTSYLVGLYLSCAAAGTLAALLFLLRCRPAIPI